MSVEDQQAFHNSKLLFAIMNKRNVPEKLVDQKLINLGKYSKFYYR